MANSLILLWIPWIYNKLCYATDLAKRVFYAAYVEVSTPKEWLFLENTNVPIYSTLFTIPENVVIRWRATTNPSVFLSTEENASDSMKHLSYLGFVVTIPDEDPIDLTNWINDVRWQGSVEPTPLDVFCLWCCEEGESYFSRLHDIHVSIISETGEFSEKGLNAFMYKPKYDGDTGRSSNGVTPR